MITPYKAVERFNFEIFVWRWVVISLIVGGLDWLDKAFSTDPRTPLSTVICIVFFILFIINILSLISKRTFVYLHFRELECRFLLENLSESLALIRSKNSMVDIKGMERYQSLQDNFKDVSKKLLKLKWEIRFFNLIFLFYQSNSKQIAEELFKETEPENLMRNLELKDSTTLRHLIKCYFLRGKIRQNWRVE